MLENLFWRWGILRIEGPRGIWAWGIPAGFLINLIINMRGVGAPFNPGGEAGAYNVIEGLEINRVKFRDEAINLS